MTAGYRVHPDELGAFRRAVTLGGAADVRTFQTTRGREAVVGWWDSPVCDGVDVLEIGLRAFAYRVGAL